MIKKNIINFDYPLKELPVIEVNQNSTASGEIFINDEEIEEASTITGTVYVVTPPSSSTQNWVRSGNDLYSSTILSLTSRKMSDGTIVVKYSFDPSAISGIADGNFYGVTIKLNADDDAAVKQAGIELIFKINSYISWS